MDEVAFPTISYAEALNSTEAGPSEVYSVQAMNDILIRWREWLPEDSREAFTADIHALRALARMNLVAYHKHSLTTAVAIDIDSVGLECNILDHPLPGTETGLLRRILRQEYPASELFNALVTQLSMNREHVTEDQDTALVIALLELVESTND